MDKNYKFINVIILFIIVILSSYIIYNSCAFTENFSSSADVSYRMLCAHCNTEGEVPKYKVDLLRQGTSIACLECSGCGCER